MRLPILLFAFLFPGISFVIHVAKQHQVSGSANPVNERIEGHLNILPVPVTLTPGSGGFICNEQTVLIMDPFADAAFDPAQVFLEVLRKKSGYGISIRSAGKLINSGNSIHVQYSKEITNSEGYQLNVSSNGIRIVASDVRGAFYAFQTLRQIMRLDATEDADEYPREWMVPAVTIADYPQFRYRGMHLDVCRHYMPLSFVKKYIDLLALHKMNRFHWHLTDDQGWRIEIKKYPRLQEVAAWRDETLIGHYRETPDRYDGTKHGGYYTQEEAKEIVAYAAQRGVMVIPEIEMPGHAQAALTAYPKLGCTAGPYEVAETWGVFDDVFCTRESTFVFLQHILDEVVEIFPAPYIHIGGDECPKTRWKDCPHCQSRIQQEGLKDEHELQSYFIRRMETYLNAKGRNIIGWDEILEGGLAPNATVMSWRGTKGGIEASKMGHDVIMTPGTHCYFDHYQADPKTEPIAIGGLTTLEKVYGFNPVPKELDATAAQHILGAQANLWTEYIGTPEHAEYMAYPRAIALAEVLWSPLERRNYNDFIRRLTIHFKTLDGLLVHYANHIMDPEAILNHTKEGLAVTWKSPGKDHPIYYKTGDYEDAWIKVDSGQVTMFDEAATIEYRANGTTIRSIVYSPSLTRKAEIRSVPSPSTHYPGVFGIRTLTDGLFGTSQFNGADWCAWRGEPVEIFLQFDEPIQVKGVDISTLADAGAWIHQADLIEVATSLDGSMYLEWATWNGPSGKQGRSNVRLEKANQTVKFVRIRISPQKAIPPGNPGAGQAPWTFIDEISLY